MKSADKYVTKFGSLSDFEKGRVELIDDDARNYAFSNCFEIASQSKPWEKVVFGQNQIYVIEAIRAEGQSPWFTCAHDEFLLSMDGDMEIHLVKLEGEQIVADTEKNGAVLVQGEPKGVAMGWMRIGRGHQAMLPKNTAYQIRAKAPSVAVLQTCKGDLSIERWSDICQMA
ncbi:hydroxyquinol 1,2-dioxygenase [Diaphorobacter sp.]|uniref:hydroxyquinol 1,2-dioxygenase n=1 Tax=Diaphorobacter sp. TaxID=1934310 RepID=UPI0028B20579|nr:hydroxyquinol 1,2-dioxygenase [Diaphorobacter sp.]